MQALGDLGRGERQYVSFVAWDWKNGRIEDVSCDPSKLGNYFVESDLPFETSPAFFRPEVLLKYKADSDKYALQERSISCRGAWHLQTFDINEAGQVHTYLKYLGDLPYEEQLHWKQYNEQPKAPLSERAFRTDIKGEFYKEYDALPSLKQRLRQLHDLGVPWWKLRSGDQIGRTHYPVTASRDEWSNEILALDQLLVEGFEEKWLRKKAEALDRSPPPNYRSLKLLEQCLIGLGFEEEHAQSITSPLHEVHTLRDKLKGHISGQTARSIASSAISKHGTFGKHFEDLCKRCDEAMEVIIEAFKDRRMS